MTELTQEYVRSLFDYRDGELYWKESGSGRKLGIPAGNVQENGYQRVKINGKKHLTHRLIFLYHHDYLPEFLDHIDGNRLNNTTSNLREATNQENQWNAKKHKFRNGKPTSSRFKGVWWNKLNKKWQAAIQIGGKQKHLGYYDSKINAALAYDRAAIKRDGEFAKTNAMLFPEIFQNL